MKNLKLILSFLMCLFILTNIPTVLCMTPAPVVYVAGDDSGDFNCSGTNDQVQINQALKFVAENPDYTTVHLKGPFTYTVNDTLLIGNDTILEGDPNAVIKLADHAGWPKEKSLITQMGSAGQNITIKGFTINGNREGNTDVTSGSDYYDLISLINCKYVNVHEMYLTNNHGNGLKTKGCSNIKFHDNEAYLLGHDVLYATNSLYVEAYNNKITCRTNSGLRVYNTNNVIFYNNDITSKGSGGAGIEIQKYNDPVIEMNDIEIYNNTIYRTALAGIWIFGSGSYPLSSANVSVYHNQIYDTGTNSSNNKIGGIVSDGFNVLVENNVIDGAYGAGIAQKNVYYSETLNGMGYVVTARNNIITNTRRSSDGMNATGVSNFLTGTHSFVLDNNCFYNNSGGNYWNVDPSTTDIQADPLYADRASHDYHLKSKAGRWSGNAWVSDSVNSPCIDAGHPLSDYSNEPEPNGDRINIGPDGNTVYASKSEMSVPTPILPVANFSANPVQGYAPLAVQFTDTSTGAPTSWEWDFGDGSPNSTEQNPDHTYNSAGTYTVVLSAYNAEGNSTSTKTNYITVAATEQASGIEWQKCLGGSSFDYGTSVKQTSDGGYIVAGGSNSNDGDVTGNHGSQDSWVVKLDESGDVVWQKCLGGSSSDYGGSIEQTSDGGYIVGGFSNSNDGNVTGNHGSQDSWVVKLDESGDVVWQKCLGGSLSDYIHNIKQTTDGGYIAIGFSNSNDGDVTGNHGGKDSWVVKLDESGNVVWQKCLGGSSSDFGSSVKQTSDGGYIVAGGSNSSDGNVTGNHGSQDSWVVKLDESGDVVWQKCLGGSSSDAANSIEQTSDGGYIVSGYSNSNDGNVTGNHGSQDSWVVKLDEGGDVVWQKCLGGSSIDYGNGIEQTSDGGYIVAGYSGSNDGDVTGNHGSQDSWVVKLDESGDVVWQKCLGGSLSDFGRNIEQTSDGGYIFAGHSNSNDGNVIGNHGNDDYWVVKLASQGPVAEFSAIPTSGSAPLNVSFTDNSTDNPTSWLWNFGDGANSVEQNPVHTYSTAGNYTVNLTVSNENGTDSKLATITVSEKPESVTEENITFTTTGSSFAPIINVTGSPTILWTFSDGTTSTSLRPNVSFGSSATRTQTLKVTPWSSLVLIDLGYSGQDGGATPSNETIPSQTNQYVSSITGLENVAPSLVKFAACDNPITSLNFSNFVELTTVECFDSGLTSINLTNTPKLERVCVEISDLSVLNLTDSVTLGDLRAADQKHGLDSLILPSTISCWHLCCRDNTLTANIPLQNAPNLKEVIIQNTNQSGELHPSSTKLTALYANNNSYTSVNLSGCFSSTYADNIRLQYNKIEHIDLTDCAGITGLQLQYNKLNQSEVDYVLHTLDGFANTNGFVYLQGNTEPSSEGLSHANNLTGKNWTVILDSESTVSIPVANFSTNVSEGYAPLTVQFYDLSENATSLSWDFNGDEISDSNESNPVYEFTTPGTYTVNLTAINEDGTDSASAIINVLKLEPPVANFTMNKTEGKVPLIVRFSDSSENATSLSWDFNGDGVSDSSETDPVYEFTTPGTYTINLTAINEDGTDSASAMINALKLEPPVANFTANETEGFAPLVVQFSDTSSNSPTGWEWDFGDGVNSTVQNPEHTYSAEGNYTVTLVASNGDGLSDPKSMNITVNRVPVLPVAKFTANETAGYAPLTVQFTDLSENADELAWDFENDGIIDSNMSGPVYEYTAPGTYTVNLTAINANGTDSTSITINVSKKPGSLLPAADFSASVTSGYAPLSVQFNDTSSGAPTSWEWDFGDGSPNSTEQNPNHTYNSPGTYTVVLSAFNAEGSSTSKQINFIKVLNNSNSGSLTLVNTNLSELSSIPRGMYIESTTESAPSNVALTYNNTLKCADITYTKPATGSLFFTNLYPATDSNLTYTLGTEGVSGSSYVNIIASNLLVAVSKRGSDYRITSYWFADDKSTQNSSYITIPAASIIDNKVTFSVVCYESNRTNVLKYNDTIYTKTPFRTINARNQNYVFVSQPIVYFSPYIASGDTGPFIVHLYSIKQEIPRKTVTPYGSRSISAFTLSYPDPKNNSNGTDLMKSNGQKSTVYVSADRLNNSTTVEYQKALLDDGWELGVYYTTNFNFVSNESAIAIMDSEYDTIVNTFGKQPKTWTALGGSGNISQAIYAYQRYGMIWRTCESGASWLSAGNLCNNYWRWWNTSIAQGIVFPAFTIQTDNEIASGSSIHPAYFKVFSNGFAANNIRLCGLNEYYFTQSAQNTTLVNITDSNNSYMRFTVNTSGHPCTLNVMTEMSNVEISHDGVTVPYTSVDDGVVFTANNNTTYVVRALPPSLVANFTSNSTSGNVPLTVQFNDTSAGSPTLWDWNFGDGTHSSTQNATHTFTTAGVYDVTLTVSRDESSSTITKTITVLEQFVFPVANFSTNVSEGYAPLSVQFNDSSKNATSVSWDFNGDGIGDSDDRYPVYEYEDPGNYTVNLTASNGNGTHSKSAVITVSEKPALVFPTANFSSNVSEGSAPLTVQFSDSSENATELHWDFGDGANSTEQNPVHTYSAGNYAVNLTVSNENGTASKSATISVLKSTPAITWNNPADITYETPLSEIQLNASASVPGSFLYNPVSGTILGAGTHTLEATFTPGDSTNYTMAAGSVLLTVNKAIPLVTWSNPADIIYGTSLNEIQLNASASVPGTFVYTPDSGTVLGAGSHTLHADFTPDDTVNYTNATANVTINVTELVPPVANFTADKTEGFAPLTIRFNDTSTNSPTEWSWEFGDGNTSTDQNPTYTYSVPGNYTVNLTARNGDGPSNVKSMDIIVKRVPAPPVANFTANETAGYAPLTVQFNDTSTNNPTSWEWNFGDGANSPVQNPEHTFSVEGNYTVTLVAGNSDGSSDPKSMNITVNRVPVLPVANFTANETAGYAPLTVQFNDLSENAGTVAWDFDGDGSSDSGDRNPVHEFTIPGTYTVNLTAINGNGTDSTSASINVSEKPVLPVANFSSNVSEGSAPLTVQFSDSSENATELHWDFGDGANSTEQNPVHTYSAPETYTVNLTASNENGTSFKITQITVTEIPVVADFTAYGMFMSAQFQDNSTGEPDTLEWDFGDGSENETGPWTDYNNVTHPYTEAGTYNVTLTASKAGSSDTVTRQVTVRNYPNVSFTATPENGTAPLTVQFNDTSDPEIDLLFWNFGYSGEGNTSNEENPMCTYTEPGNYTVKLSGYNGTSTYHNTVTKNITVTGKSGTPVTAPVANFTFTPETGIIPCEIQFNDTSDTGGAELSYEWNFGNGIDNATTANTTCTFNSAGTYNVTLTVTNSAGSDSITRPVIVSMYNVSFAANITNGTSPLTVQFNDTSDTEANTRYWYINNSRLDIHDSDFVHTFVTPGVYTVKLEACNPDVAIWVTATKDITVTAPIAVPVMPEANFSSNVTEGYAPLTVQFSDSSENATVWHWDFGDNTNSTDQNPTHIYSMAGSYSVNLTASNANGTSSETTTITVSGPYAENYSCVATWSLSGNGTGVWGYADPANGPYNIPFGVAIAPSGYMYVADRENNSVVKLDSNGSIIARWGSYGNATGQFNGPKGVAVDSSGNVYIVDSINHRIQKFDSNGNFITTWGSYGEGDGQFDNGPDSIAVDSSGNVYVAGNGPDRIQKFDSYGNFISRFGPGNVEFWIYRPNGIAVDSNGNIYVIDGEGCNVVELNSNGELIRIFGTAGKGGDGQLGGPSGVAVDSFGNVYVSDNFYTDNTGFAYGSQIQKFNNNGSFVTRWGSYGNGTGQFYGTGGIAVDSSGNVYVTDYGGNRLEKFASDKPVVTPVLPTAVIGANTTSGTVPLTVQFNDLSLDETLGRVWTFGDGGNSTDANPIYTYQNSGTFIVNLTVTNENGTNVTSKAITVSEKPVLPVANFSANVTSGFAPLLVQFNDLSENATSIDWDFGDESNATERNPIHEFTIPGTYIVNLTASNENGTDSTSASINVSEKPVLPIANFSTNVSEGYAPLSVQFTDLSENATSLSWDFNGDGISDSNETDPVYEFTTPGTHTVNLTAINEDGTDSKLDTINVTEYVLPVADFTANPKQGKVPLTVQFNDSSENATSLSWDFENDGVIDSNETDPVHVFTTPGNYTVNLTVINEDGTDSASAIVNVLKLEPPVANFTANEAAGFAPLVVQFNDTSSNSPTEWEWDFGDRANSTVQNPEHTFSAEGNYTVTLVARNGDGSSDPGLMNITVKRVPAPPVANFTANPIEGAAPLTVQFNDLSENATLLSWDFNGDGINDSNEPNPVYVFITPGYYTVNLTASNDYGTNSKLSTINVTKKDIQWEFSPQEPVCGDILYISGSTSPEEKVDVFVSFEKTVPVSDRKFEYILENITVPEGMGNLFTVEASGVNNLNVRMKMVVWTTKSSGASESNATVSQSNVPAGAYTIKIDGDAGESVSEVNLKITALQEIKADSKGNFSYSYNTTSVPAGNFEIKAGDIVKEITLKPKKTEEPASALPVANFSSNVDEGYAPLSVQFIDRSENADTINWDFNNDGIGDSTEKNPVHNYASPGAYTVNLTAGNKNGIDSKLSTITVLKKPEPSVPPVANFISNVSKGYAPLTVQFTDYSENAVSWSWDFNNDGQIDSSYQNPVYSYAVPGIYTVKLTVANADGGSSKAATIKVLEQPEEPVLPEANFSINVSEGYAPLSVQFTDYSKYAALWSWDFDNNGQVDSTSKDPGYVYSAPGVYTVKLTVANKNGTDSISATVRVSEPSNAVLPVANFSSNVTEGYAPLTVQFTDSSENAAGVTWDFNDDGTIDSTSRSPVHVYNAPGTYRVNLTAVNENGSASKIATITVLESSSSGGSSRGGSGSGGSSGAGGSPEPARNVEVKELSQDFIKGGESVSFDFSKNATSILSITFDSKKTAGKTTTIVEMLKDKSTLTPNAPEGEVYGYLNIWVGNGGYGTDKSIENAVIHFRVEKSWIEENGIDQSSIVLNRYNNSKWNPLPTSLSGEDDRYLYFTAKTPGFSPFAITGKTTATRIEIKPDTNVSEQNSENQEANVEQRPDEEGSTNTSGKGSTIMPGFGAVYGITGLLAVFQYRRKQK